MSFKKRDLIFVEWEDITTTGRWVEEDDESLKKPIRCHSVGWKVGATRKHIILTPMRDDKGRCTDTQTIPKGTIINIRRLE